MELHSLQINRKGQKQLLFLLDHEFPVSNDNFFEIIQKLGIYANRFYDEVVENSIRLGNSRKNDYINGLTSQFASLKHTYNAEVIDAELKKYDENLSAFPHFNNQALRWRLSMNFSKIASTDVNGETISDIVENKQLQMKLLMLAFELKTKEILQFLQLSENNKEGKLVKPDASQTYNQPAIIKREAEKKFLQALQEKLPILGVTATGFLSKDEFEQRKEVLLAKTKDLKLDTIDEINDNLLLLQLKKSKMYLKRLQQDFNKLINKFEEVEFYFLSNDGKPFVEPDLKIQINKREDIIHGLRSLNMKRLELTKNLLKRIQERLDDYNEVAKEQKRRKDTATSNQLVLGLFDLGFFSLPRIRKAPNTKVSETLSFYFGLNDKNIKSNIEKMDSVKSPNIPPYYKQDMEKVQKFNEEKLGPPDNPLLES